MNEPAIDAALRQHYELWKKSVDQYMAEMDSVLAGQDAGGRLVSVTASMEFAYDMLRNVFDERLEQMDAAEAARRMEATDLYVPGRL